LEGCRSCGGTWFDANELDKILQKSDLLTIVEKCFSSMRATFHETEGDELVSGLPQAFDCVPAPESSNRHP